MTEPIPALRFGNVTYHFPFARLIRSHTAQERDELAASIRAHKRVLVRVVTYDSPAWGERCVIDGAARLELAAELGIDVPVQHRGPLGDEAARAECLALNVDRRHLTPEERQAVRASRVERVRAARDDGRSLREIARAEGVSPTQVARDLADAAHAGVTPVTPESRVAGVTWVTPESRVAGVTGVTPESRVAGVTGGTPAPGGAGDDRSLKALERGLRALVRADRGRVAGALPDLLRGPHRDRLERIAARHGVPLSGDRWPLMDALLAVASDLLAEMGVRQK
ncbi:hypothetical protein R5W24_003925 [Gemmata sp. JC717]|uniref:hypothetical protein n=1 Tax=Gemmata algarum TaxID=2975278 RepID=UPI0021BABA2A|nr:hypothetical protein [Gemmata algarum]MDY3554796.1 hypothetical protein [Gemmata algarum]